MIILNGQDLAGYIKERQAKQVRMLRQAHGIYPKLAIVTDTDNPVIETYMRLKKHYGEDILIDVEIFRTNPDDVMSIIDELNVRQDIQGVIVQLPISDMSRADEILGRVSPSKDVDGLSPQTVFDAATPTAINWLLSGHSVELSGKKIAIIGRGRLVGAPLEKMWRASELDVEVFEKGDDLSHLQQFDVIVTAAGAPHTIMNNMVKPGAVLVDAGTAVEDGRVRGDVDEQVRKRQDISITPEKGGVGPLTVTALFDNVINACLKIANIKDKD